MLCLWCPWCLCYCGGGRVVEVLVLWSCEGVPLCSWLRSTVSQTCGGVGGSALVKTP